MEEQEKENERQEQEKEVQPASEEKKTNKAMLIVIGVVGVAVIAAGAFFLTTSQSGTPDISDTTIQEEHVHEDTMMEGRDITEDETSMSATDSAD